MPKPIKRKLAKPSAPVQEDLGNVLEKIGDTIERRQRQLTFAAVAFLVLIALAIGLYAYRSGTVKEAQRLSYEGYKEYQGLYAKTPVPEQERYRIALEKFKEANERKETPFSLFYMANCYYSLGNYPEAISTLERLNRAYPDDEKFVPLSYYRMAMVHLKLGEDQQALKDLDVLFNYRTDSLKDLALAESARILEGLGREDEAKEKYRLIAERFPNSLYYAEAKRKAGVEEEKAEEGEAKKGK